MYRQVVRPTPPVHIWVREDPPDTWVTLDGELDLTGSDVFDRRMWEVQMASRQIVLDLRALEFIDSAGVRSIVASQLRAVHWRGRLVVLCGHSGQVRRMLSLSGRAGLLEISDRSPRPAAGATPGPQQPDAPQIAIRGR